MGTLAADSIRDYEYSGEDLFNDLPVIGTDIIYEGAAVGENGSGYMRPLQASDVFAGFAVRQADNSTGNAGDKMVNVRSKGLVKLTVAGVNSIANGNDGTPVYASDDDTFTLTAQSNSLIGRTHRYIASGIAIVYFEATSQQV
jgi:hypothetical protein